jgi:hypothetical protein
MTNNRKSCQFINRTALIKIEADKYKTADHMFIFKHTCIYIQLNNNKYLYLTENINDTNNGKVVEADRKLYIFCTPIISLK